MSLPKFVISSAIVLAIASCARADFVISFGDLSIGPGDTTFIDAFIRSTVPAGQTLNNTNFEFRLTTGGPTRLEFTSPTPSSSSTFSSSNYVFFNDSSDQTGNSNVFGDAFQTVVINDSIIGGDSTFSTNDVTVPFTKVLLAKVPITAATTLPPAPGNTFTINLVPNSGSGGFNTLDGNSGFGNSSPSTPNYFPFTSAPGTITVVPEPATLGALATAGAIALAVCLRRRRAKLA